MDGVPSSASSTHKLDFTRDKQEGDDDEWLKEEDDELDDDTEEDGETGECAKDDDKGDVNDDESEGDEDGDEDDEGDDDMSDLTPWESRVISWPNTTNTSVKSERWYAYWSIKVTARSVRPPNPFNLPYPFLEILC